MPESVGFCGNKENKEGFHVSGGVECLLSSCVTGECLGGCNVHVVMLPLWTSVVEHKTLIW